MKGHAIWLQDFRERKALTAGRGREGFREEVGEERGLEGWSDFAGGGGAFGQAQEWAGQR